MSVTEGQIRGKYHQDTNVPRSNPAISQIHKNIERHTAHTIVSWPNPNILVFRYIVNKILFILQCMLHLVPHLHHRWVKALTSAGSFMGVIHTSCIIPRNDTSELRAVGNEGRGILSTTKNQVRPATYGAAGGSNHKLDGVTWSRTYLADITVNREWVHAYN